jgi:hypothetical protein
MGTRIEMVGGSTRVKGEELTWSTDRTFAKEDPEDVTKFFYPRPSAYAELRTARSVQQA